MTAAPSHALAARLLKGALPRLLSGVSRRACQVALVTALSQAVLPHATQAQEASTSTALLANGVTFDGELLVATGDVEVLQGDRRLTASRITYNQTTGALSIDGPIRLTQNGTEAVILASAAELDTELQNGILTSARMVIDRQMQLAAARLDVVDGRYIRMQKSVASTCEVCVNRPVPLWEIRAQEIIHDSEARQLYFTNAQFRLMDVPVLWLPHLRVPDPTLKRANGFLVPEIRTDSTLGTGIVVPYFITLGDHRDLTVSPYIATKTTTLNLRYRQAFSNGDLELNGAVSSDDTRDGLRAYLYAQGQWDIGRGLKFGVDLRAASDIAYLADYGIDDGDYLTSKVTLTRYRAEEALDAQLAYSRSLRASDVVIEDKLPFILGEFSYERFLTVPQLPGRLSFGLSASTSYRDSEDDIDGYDVIRLGAETRWRGGAVFGPGLKLDSTAALMADAYIQQQYSAYENKVIRLTGEAETRLSWPLLRRTASGASQLLEPMLQLGWSDTSGGAVPNTDSRFVEFDEGNLLTLARFPGADRRETGLTAAAGLHFAHFGQHSEYGLTLGRVLYLEDIAAYTESSGLDSRQSDWLLAATMQFDTGLAFTSRALFDDKIEVTKWETRLDYMRPRYSLGTSYAYVIADALEERDTNLNEFGFDGAVKIARNWSATAQYLYDFSEDSETRVGVGVEFQNECSRFNLGLTRRYWNTDDLDPTTRLSFSVGFGAFASEQQAGSCAF
ncbi:LPS-assembly protein LptD [Celeribacter naphthalenivorans]|uniref:LPS-assembly protein LptD n=1 Tax=Celeribacter naphthalenivorans TaxID=1614694 RepID=UPI001CF9BA23|nr:LPS assembly protein LptD [Celeribacter naphthalenivorans]